MDFAIKHPRAADAAMVFAEACAADGVGTLRALPSGSCQGARRPLDPPAADSTMCMEQSCVPLLLGETCEITAVRKAFEHGGFQPPDRCAKRTGKNERMIHGKTRALSHGSSSFFLCPEAEAACARVSSSSGRIPFGFFIQATSPAEVQEGNPPGSGVWGPKRPPAFPLFSPTHHYGLTKSNKSYNIVFDTRLNGYDYI